MDTHIIASFYFADELLKAVRFFDDPQAKMTTAEVMTVGLTAAHFFCGNQRKAARFLKIHRYIPYLLSEGHFNRRLHRIPLFVWQKLFSTLAEYFKRNNDSNEYVVDSFPIPVCDNIRIFRSKIFSGDPYRGYLASKGRYFYGIRAHVIATVKQEPIEVIFAPGAENDISAFKRFDRNVLPGAIIYADRAYQSYAYEDLLKEHEIFLVAQRKSNSKRPLRKCIEYLQNYWRKAIETTFSRICSLFPRSIHAVTSKGFELKVFLFILAYSLSLVV